MIKSKAWCDKVKRVFPKTGPGWLLGLKEQIEVLSERYSLTEISICPIESVNLVLFAKSEEFGDVALKIGAPHEDIQHEIQMLLDCQGRGMCKIYAYSKEEHYLLIERILPGDMLYDNHHEEEVFTIGLSVITNSQCYAEIESNYPTYRSWADNNRELLSSLKRMDKTARAVSNCVYACIDEMDDAEFDLYLLHGDLHHQNILRQGDGSYKIIDPKGVIGPNFMESARFMNNHIDRMEGSRKDNYTYMVNSFASAYDVDVVWVWRGLYILLGLSSLWNHEIEDGAFGRKELEDLAFVASKVSLD